MAIQRQEVQGLAPVAQAASRPAAVIQRALQQPVIDTESSKRVASILDGLQNFTTAASEASFRQAQIDVEQKKINGMSLAVSGGKLGEEASKAEQMGYDIVQSQSELGRINEQLANHLVSNPETSDEDFAKMKDEQYGALLAKYQDRAPEVFKAISVKAQESQAALYKVQQSSREAYRKQKGAETLNYNIGSTLDSAHTVEQGTQLINQYMAQGKALGLTEFESKDAIFNQMKLAASQGDSRLIQFVENTDWGKYALDTKQAKGLYKTFQKQAEAEAKQARLLAQQAQQQANVFAYGAGLAEIENLAKAGAPDEEIMAKMQNLQKMGLKFSPSTVASYLTMGKTMSQEKINLANNINLWQSNKAEFNLATNPQIPTKDKIKVMEAIEGAITEQSKNIPEAQRGDWQIQQLMMVSKQEGLPVKTIGTALESLTQIDTQAPMSPAVASWTKMLIAADDQTIRMNVPSEKDQAVLFGMRDVLINNQGQDAEKVIGSAIARGQAIRDNNVPLNPQQNKKITTEANRAVGQLKDPTQTTWYFRSEGLPSSTEDYIANQIAAKTKSLYQVTGDITKANEIAIKEYKQNNIIMTGGVTANIGARQLATFVPEFAKGADSAEVVQKKAVASLDYKVDNLLKAQSKEDGIEYNRDAAKVVFSNSGSTYQVYIGGLSTGTYSTSELKDEFNEQFFQKWNAEQEKQQRESTVRHGIKETEDLQRKFNMMMPE